MKKIKLLTLSFCLLLIGSVYVSADNNVNDDMSLIQIDIDKATEHTNWSAVMDTTYFHPVVLETTDDCLIGEVLKIIYEDDMLIVADNMSHSVFFFNTEGKFLNSICKIGRGPDEYFELTDISVKDGKVWLLDNISCKVLCYDYTGKMLHKFETQGGVSIQALENSILIGDVWGGVAAGGKYLLSEYNFEGNQVGKYIPYSAIDMFRDSGDWQPFFAFNNNSVDYLVSSKNIVYHYENGIVTQKYNIDFGRYNLPNRLAIRGIAAIIDRPEYNNCVLGVDKISESSTYRFIEFRKGTSPYFCIVDKYTNSVISLSTDKTNTVFQTPRGTKNIVYKDYLLSYHSGIELYQLREYIWKVNPENIKGKEIDLYNISQGLSADDNGVVLMMKLKH